ncbi:MAG: PrpF domain-containing protein [Pseudomonadota bacterium]
MTDQRSIAATFMRGGTSKGVFFRWEDMPGDAAERDGFLCAALGSPDPYGRQLDGMGGGISSLSKAMMVRRSEREGVDVDYLFAQIEVGRATVDYASNCGNLSAAVGAFAVDQGFVQMPDGPTRVRMFNENTEKRIDCHLTVRGGRAAVTGQQEIAGVAGTGSAIRLEFLDPGGARTGKLLPMDTPQEGFYPVDNDTKIDTSFVDAANPCIFVGAAGLGLTACELPGEIAANTHAMDVLERFRRAQGAVAGFGERWEDVPESAPKIAIIGPPSDSQMLTGETLRAEDCDIQVRMISMGQPHLAIPLTGAMCTAVAARIPGTVVAACARDLPQGQPLRIGTASGVVPAMAEVDLSGPEPCAISASVYRTARTLMEGKVFATL